MYVAAFKVTGNFNIHIERAQNGFISLLQRSTESGSFVSVKDFDNNAQVIDDAVASISGVFPMWFRVESKHPVTMAEVISVAEVEAVAV